MAQAETETSAASASPPSAGLHGSDFSFQSALPPWVLAAMLCLLAFAVQRAYTRTTRRVALNQRLLLAGIRAAAVLILLFCLARPVMVKNYDLREKGLCFIALDTSGSMEMRDGADGKSRSETAVSILAAHQSHIARLEAQFELQRYAFDVSARKLPRLPGESGAPGKEPAAGASTDMAALLELFTSEASGMSSAGALIISDGRHNAPKDVLPAALALQRAGVPIFCIGVGHESTPSQYRDVRIKELNVPEKAFIGSRMILRVEIESTLPVSMDAPLTLEVAGKKIHESNIVLNPGPNVVYAPVEVSFVPSVLGVHRVLATLGALPGEADANNNSRGAFFRVYRSKLGIWYVEGAMRKEFGAIRSALETAPNVQLHALNAFSTRTSSPRELLPATVEEQSQLKLVIIGDLPASRFNSDALRDLKVWVEEGGALLMIGGASNFGAGEWNRTPLEPAFPVEMTLTDGFQEGPLRIVLSEDESRHSVLSVAETPALNAEMWKLLPPLAGINKIKNVKPGARVLLSADSRPLLVVQEYGKGRSAVFTSDMTWQWILKAGQGETHKRFWRNLATWLTRSDYRDTDKAVFADAERLHLESGQEAVFHAYVHATEKSGPAIKDSRIVFSLTKVQGEFEAPVFKEDAGRGAGEFIKTFAPGSAGNYRFRAAAMNSSGQVIDSDSVDIQVTAPNLEHDNPKANPTLLRRIAELSGGQYFAPEKSTEAFDALLKRQAGYSKSVSGVTELWNHPAVMILFMSLLTAEWLLRKRWKLI